MVTHSRLFSFHTLSISSNMVQIKIFEFNPFQENTYVLYDETNECVIVDPGCYGKDEQSELSSFIEASGLTVKMLLNHRSGLPNYVYFMANSKWDKKIYVTNNDVLDFLVTEKPEKSFTANSGWIAK